MFELAGHVKHLELFEIEYVSAPHVIHVDIAVAAVADEYFPAEHCVQAWLPFVALYLPSIHGVHRPPSGPK